MSRSRRGSPCPSPSVNSVSGVLLGKLTRAEPILHGRLPPIRSPTPLLHTHSLQIESLNPQVLTARWPASEACPTAQNFGRRDARRKLWAAPNRLEALGTVSGIMNDIGYYRHFMQEEEPETSPVPERVQARRYSEEDAEEKFDWTQKLAEGWTYERSHKAKGAGPTAGRYKHALNAKDGGLSWCELKAAELSSSGW